MRKSIAAETAQEGEQASRLKDEIAILKDKDRLHLEEIKKLLLEKVDMQSTGLDQRAKAMEREKEFG